MRARKLTAALAAVPLILASGAGVALADDISNNLDGTVDAVAEVMPLNVGGPNGTTQLYVTPANGDGKNGCNLTGSSTLSLSMSSSDTSVATVSPSSVTFTACSDTKTLTVTPVSQGTATISAAQTSNSTAGSFELSGATFTVNVAAPANTAPMITVTGVVGGSSYNKGSVPAATCVVTDAEDGDDTFPATLSGVSGVYASDGIGSQTASCSYTDAGGQTASASETYSIVDPTVPAISPSLTPSSPDGSNGWYKSDVTLTWTVTEPESPNSLSKTGCDEQNITADQEATVYKCSASSAGGSADEQSVTIKRDATAPTAIAFVGGPATDGKYYPNNLPIKPTCTADDALSGVASCEIMGYSTDLGTHTMTAKATDHAGNHSTVTRSYTVRKLTLNGFYAPVDKGIFNTVKSGSTVPLKFEVFDGSVEQRELSKVKGFTTKVVSCQSGLGEDAVEELAASTSSNGLRYDTTGDQYVYNWKTSGKAGTCYEVKMTTEDDSSITALFKLK